MKQVSKRIMEIMDDPIKSGFIELTRFFNYVWYGMFNIDKNDFDEINNKFNEFIVDINTGDWWEKLWGTRYTYHCWYYASF